MAVLYTILIVLGIIIVSTYAQSLDKKQGKKSNMGKIKSGLPYIDIEMD